MGRKIHKMVKILVFLKINQKNNKGMYKFSLKYMNT